MGITTSQLDDIDHVVQYASLIGKPIDAKLLQPIATARQEVQAGNLTSATETAFWEAVSKLSAMVAPATVESIRCGMPAHGKSSAPRKAARVYTWVGGVVLSLLVLSQGYWYTLNSVLNEYSAALTQIKPYAAAHEEVWKQLSEGNPTGPTPQAIDLALIERFAKEAKNSQNSADKSEARSLDERNRLEASLSQSADAAGRMSRLFAWIAFPSNENPGTKTDPAPLRYYWVLDKDSIRSVQAAKIVLDIFSKYWLPILCGLLGASLFIVRSLATDIRAMTYVEEENIGFNLRFFLGGVAGIAVVWFFGPESLKALGTGEVVSSLSPLALAFIAGYSVELVFSVIDRIISAFSFSEPKPKQNTP